MASAFSVADVVAGARRALTRFPEANAAGLCCAAVSCSIIALKGDTTVWLPWLWAGLLALPLSVGLGVWRQLAAVRGWRAWWPTVALALGLLAYALGAQPQLEAQLARFMALLLAAHLLVAFWPYQRAGHEAEFWHYNRSFFLRAVLTAVFSATIFFGVGGALLALDALFDFRFSSNQYGYVFVSCLFTVGTLIFTAGLPTRLDDTTSEASYPRPLLHFVQYILLPLVTLYLVILYAYGVYILLGQFPKGIVSWLVLVFSVAGVLALLLVFPLRESGSRPWVRGFARGFYPALLPLVGLLIYAIWLRISAYGLTEARVVLVYLGVWLGAVALYHTLRRRIDIKLIPMSLALFTALAAVGPLSMSSLSVASQNARLERLFSARGLLREGRYVQPDSLQQDSVAGEVHSIVTYMNQWHGLRGLGSWAQPMLDTLGYDSLLLSSRYSRYRSAERLLTAMQVGKGGGIRKRLPGDDEAKGEDFFLLVQPDHGLLLPTGPGRSTYLALTPGENLLGPAGHPSQWAVSDSAVVFAPGASLAIDLAPGLRELLLALRRRAGEPDIEVVNAYGVTYQPDSPDSTLAIPVRGAGWRGRFVVIHLAGRISGRHIRLTRFQGVLYQEPLC